MNIAVFCGSSVGANPEFKRVAAELGGFIGETGNNLVYGAGYTGLMKEVSDSTLKAGGTATGVAARVLKEREPINPGLTDLIVVDTISERKKKMIEIGDIFIALPGGPGTMEEIWEAVSLLRVGVIHKKCVFLNIAGFFDSIKKMFKSFIDEAFVLPEEISGVKVVDTTEEVFKMISSLKKEV